MGQTLTGQIVADTYDALIKVTDNNTITGTKKRMTDGVGNDTPLLISSTDVQVDGNFLTESVQFNTATAQTADTVGKIAWNDQDGTIDVRLKGGNVTLQVGQEQVARVVNKTGANLLESEYKVVKVDGAQGNRLKIALAQANNDANSAETLGIVTETINDNQEGFITTSGLVRNINTTGSLQGETWADGDMLYLSGTTPGQLTKVKPTAPTHTVIMGYVVRAHITQGQIYVKVDNGYELDELHNVLITTPTDGQVLAYESASGLWKNTTNGNIGGTGTTNFVPKFTSASAIGNSNISDSGTLITLGSNSYVNGSLGIGTSSPSTQLHLSGSANLRFTNTANTSGFDVGLLNGTADATGIINQRANTNITILTNNSERMRISGSGTVLVNTTTSTFSGRLIVHEDLTSRNAIIVRATVNSSTFGYLRFVNAADAQIGGIFQATATTINYATSSDYRLKQDLKDYSGLNIVNAIKTYDFEWKSEKSRMHGVLAHELQSVLPYAVNGEKDGDEMQGVDYSKIVPVLVKAIQELNEKVKQMEGK